MRNSTICYCIKDDFVLLGLKKRGFGVGKYDGYGGKVDACETIEEGAIRELFEESGLVAKPSDLEKVAVIDFYFSDIPKEKNWDQQVHIYTLKTWKGEPVETEEMKPLWFKKDKIPIDKMWGDIPYWFSEVMQGMKFVGEFTFEKSGEAVVKYELKEVKSF